MDWPVTYEANLSAFTSACARSSLSEFESLGLEIVRPCRFSFPAKILTPVDDILVPLVTEKALSDLFARSGIAGVIATRDMAASVPDTMGLAIAHDPMRALNEIHLALANMPDRLWQDFHSAIDPSAIIHPTAWIAPRNVRIGAHAVVMAGAVVHERSDIGTGTRIHSHVVIGSDAYEIITLDGRQSLRPQTGGVATGEECEIMAGVVVTRSAFCGATIIDSRSVLDCNVVVSHDCRIGQNVRIGGSSWIGGRVTIGDHASIGPNCTIGNGLAVGEAATVSLGSVVTRNVAQGAHVSGNFAIEHERMLNHIRRIR